ncbi:hypothetical protein GE09DRAFT_967853 [Coniochaeta sp. 2T2.1]|nr:hypothetical protein GE09DRAFT_967853 [Coniochaeta sp. 2T2.1]
MRADTQLKKARNGFLKASGKNFLYLQILFLALFCWVLGSLYKQETKVHNLHIVFVNYDNQTGSIAEAIRTAYSSLEGKKFPSLNEFSPADYPTPADLREAVCRAHYWAAIYIAPGASARLEAALTGNSTLPYDPSNVLTYIWNEARYPQIVDATVSGSIQTLSQTARIIYTSSPQIPSLTTPSALSAFAQPWTLNSVNIQPTTQGSRAIYNTIVIILIMIQEFFYLGIINALYINFKIYNRANPYRIIMIRTANSLLYTFIGSLCGAGAMWAFKATWHVNYSQWVLTWMALWLFAHVNFLALDSFTIWLAHPFVPMSLITWIIFNVTSILLPFELSPGFYKIGYAFPAHNVYQVLTDIWSGGCNPQLHIALPVLFTWEVVGTFLAALGGRAERRKSAATAVSKEGEGETEERVRSPDEIEKVRTAATEADPERGSSVIDEEGDRDTDSELSRALSRVEDRIRKQQSKASRVEYGPAFGAPFDTTDSN